MGAVLGAALEARADSGFDSVAFPRGAGPAVGCVQRERAGGGPAAGLVLLRADGEQTPPRCLHAPVFKQSQPQLQVALL